MRLTTPAESHELALLSPIRSRRGKLSVESRGEGSWENGLTALTDTLELPSGAAVAGRGAGSVRSLAILRYGTFVLVLVSAAIWGIVTYRSEVAAATRVATESAALIGQYAERLFQTQTILHRAAIERAAEEPEAFLRSEEYHRYLAALEGTEPLTAGIAVVAFDGEMVASSRSFPVDLNVGERGYLTDVETSSQLVIDRIFLEPSNTDALVIASPFSEGGFRGVVVSAVPVTVLRQFLQGMAPHKQEIGSLLREDGKLLMRNVPSVPIMLPEDAAGVAAIRRAESGSYVTTAISDNIQRIYGYTKVDGVPLFAVFGRPTEIVITTWLARVIPVWALLAAIGTFTLLMAGLIQRSTASQFEAEQSRNRATEAERLAEQRRQLMGEMNHRVKNNLSLVGAMISIQMRKEGKVDGNELKARVMAISEVHELLYRTPDSDRMDFGEILLRLCTSPAVNPLERGVSLHHDIAPGVAIDPDHATALALAAAEIVTNAVKHAFPEGAKGQIFVTLRRSDGGGWLEIRDDGVGLPAQPSRNSGLQIVDGLVAQVGGTIERRNDGGASVVIRFPTEPELAQAAAKTA